MPRLNAMTESFMKVTVLGKPALFTPARIDRATVPQGYYLYELRHDDDCQGNVVQIALNIIVNHWGSIIPKEKILLPSDGYLDIDPMDINYGVGGYCKITDFGGEA